MNVFSKNGLSHEKLIWGLALDGEESACYLVLVRKKNKKLQAVESFEMGSLTEALSKLQKSPGIPVAVSLRLEGLTEALIPEDSLDAVSQVLGVAVRQPHRFVVQHWPGQAGYFWSSVVSRKSLEAGLDKLAPLGHRLIHISLSPIAAAWLLPALEDFQPGEAYQWSPGVCWQQGEVGLGRGVEIENREERLSQVLRVAPQELPAYAAVLQSELQLASQLPLLQKSRLRMEMGLSCLRISWMVFVFGLAACLMLAYSRYHFQQEISDLDQGLTYFSGERQEMLARQNQLREEAAFLESQAEKSLQDSQLIPCLDAIFSLTPAALRFQSLSFFPEDKERDALDPEADMLLRGEAQTAGALAAFTQKLDELDFLEEVVLQESSFSPEASNYPFCITARLALP
jgi:hypothetical protein